NKKNEKSEYFNDPGTPPHVGPVCFPLVANHAVGTPIPRSPGSERPYRRHQGGGGIRYTEHRWTEPLHWDEDPAQGRGNVGVHHLPQSDRDHGRPWGI